MSEIRVPVTVVSTTGTSAPARTAVPSSAGAAPTAPSPAAALQPQPARVLQTTATASGSGYQVLLQLGNAQVQVKSALPLPGGTLVQLRQGTDGQLSLILPGDRQTLIDQALRQHLPRQGSLGPLFDALASLAKQRPDLTPLLRQLAALRLPTQPPPGSQQLQHAIQRSGLFFEAALAGGNQQPLQDLKGLLLLLRQQLGGGGQQPPTGAPDLLPRVEQALSRISANQLQSAQQSEGQQRIDLLLELPLQTPPPATTLRVRIQRDGESQRETEPAGTLWRLCLEFDLDAGPLAVELTLRGRQLSTVCYCDTPLRRQLAPVLPQLRQRLEGTGLEIEMLVARPLEQRPVQPPPASGRLVDIHS